MIAAFFDFDGTLYTGHIWQDLVRQHRATGRQRRWIVAYVVRNMAPAPLYKLGLMSQEAFYRQWGETMGWLLRGWTVDEAQALFEQLTREQIVPHVRSDVLAIVRQHQERGHLVALVSATFVPWLETVARQLAIAHAIGTPLEMQDGRYTGRIIAPLCQGPGKPARTRTYLDRNGLEIDWAESFGYADSGTDLDLLTQVGHATAVYPDDVLLAHARAEGWPVIGEGGR